MVHAVPGWFLNVFGQRVRPIVPMGTMVQVVRIVAARPHQVIANRSESSARVSQEFGNAPRKHQ